jgi:hypothetical protein
MIKTLNISASVDVTVNVIKSSVSEFFRVFWALLILYENAKNRVTLRMQTSFNKFLGRRKFSLTSLIH